MCNNPLSSLASICNWIDELTRDRTSLEDDPRQGSPKSATTPETIATVQEMMLDS